MDRQFYVYIYFDGETPIYVGKGKGNRYKKHLSLCKKIKPGKNPFYDKLNNMESIGIKPTIKIVESNLTDTEALKLEFIYEQRIGTRRDNTGPLFNLNPCGIKNPILSGKDNPMYGKSLYDTWFEKYGSDIADNKLELYRLTMSKSKKGTKHTKDTKDKMSSARLKWHKNKDEDTELNRRESISKSWDSNRKKEQSKRIAELNKKMTGSKHPRSSKCIIEGKIYESISEVQKAYGFKNHNTVTFRLKSPNFPDWKRYDYDI